MSDYAATCYFLNVGQGTSQVISLDQQRVIIIDTGKERSLDQSPLISLLGTLHTEAIEALILSHNDSDHIGDAINVLDRYKGKIRKIYFLHDRHTEKDSKIYKDVKKAITNAVNLGYVERCNVRRLESGKADDIFVDNEISVSVLYPDFLANENAGCPNDTCAIITLSVGERKIIFSGDASIEAWKLIVQTNGEIISEILTVPHHGGNFVNDIETNDDLEWFHNHVKSKYAVVSVRANKKYKHPLPCVIRSFVNHNVEIFCTQSTAQCHKGQNGGNDDCCGTIVADIGMDNTHIRNHELLRAKKEEFSQRLCEPQLCN